MLWVDKCLVPWGSLAGPQHPCNQTETTERLLDIQLSEDISLNSTSFLLILSLKYKCWYCLSLILTLRRQKLGDLCDFMANLTYLGCSRSSTQSYTVRYCLNHKRRNRYCLGRIRALLRWFKQRYFHLVFEIIQSVALCLESVFLSFFPLRQ